LVSADNPRSTRQPAVRLVGAAGRRLWGLDGTERLRRTLSRAGLGGEGRSGDEGLIIIRADYLYDESLVRSLAAQPGVALAGDAVPAGGERPIVAAHVPAASAAMVSQDDPATAARQAGLRVLGPVELAGDYDSGLRKRARPYLLPLESTPRLQLERATFAGAYKGATDFVTKFLWPWPARQVTRWCASLGITPNAVTFASLLLVLLAFWLFWSGQFALGLVAAWAMTFLDTVDGKLARVTLTSTRLGEVFDHGIDLIHPPFWYWAWYTGLAGASVAVSPDWLDVSLWIIVIGYVLGRVEEGIFIARFGIELHIWRPIDYWFRTITARRNSNLAILTVAVLVGAPAEGFVAVAAWTVISLAFHLVRIAQAFLVRSRGQPIRSWLTEQA
jgi:phosphatidylglycerophosphate synthase